MTCGEIIKEARRLEKMATRAPWGAWNAYGHGDIVRFLRIGNDAYGDGPSIQTDYESEDITAKKADVEFLLFLRNHIDTILTGIEAACTILEEPKNEGDLPDEEWEQIKKEL